MFDSQMRVGKEKLFVSFTQPFLHLPPWVFTLGGGVMGVGTAVLLSQQHYLWGFLCWFLNRLFDGMDGTLARLQKSQSDLGGYLDILLDFVVYALIPIGLVIGQPSPTAYLSLVILLATYYVNAASWMYLSAILEKRHHQAQNLTTVTMPAGIIGGTETIIFYTLFILFPAHLVWLFYLMSLLVGITVLQRLVWAIKKL